MAQPKLRFFEVARKLSLKSQSETKLGCVIVSKNRIVGMGFNDMRKTHPRATTPFNTLHAELHALIGLDFTDLRGCDVYVYREFKNGLKALSKPCASCHLALQLSGVSRVFYTTNGHWDVIEF